MTRHETTCTQAYHDEDGNWYWHFYCPICGYEKVFSTNRFPETIHKGDLKAGHYGSNPDGMINMRLDVK